MTSRRSRRQFRPTFDRLSQRLVLSNVGGFPTMDSPLLDPDDCNPGDNPPVDVQYNPQGQLQPNKPDFTC